MLAELVMDRGRRQSRSSLLFRAGPTYVELFYTNKAVQCCWQPSWGSIARDSSVESSSCFPGAPTSTSVRTSNSRKVVPMNNLTNKIKHSSYSNIPTTQLAVLYKEMHKQVMADQARQGPLTQLTSTWPPPPPATSHLKTPTAARRSAAPCARCPPRTGTRHWPPPARCTRAPPRRIASRSCPCPPRRNSRCSFPGW